MQLENYSKYINRFYVYMDANYAKNETLLKLQTVTNSRLVLMALICETPYKTVGVSYSENIESLKLLAFKMWSRIN